MAPSEKGVMSGKSSPKLQKSHGIKPVVLGQQLSSIGLNNPHDSSSNTKSTLHGEMTSEK